MRLPVYIFALSTLFLAACGGKLDGTYQDASGMASYTFKGSKVTLSAMGVESELDYKVEDNKVKIATPGGGALVMKLLDDGSIEGPMGIRMAKKK